MKLADFVAGTAQALPLQGISQDGALAREIQDRLGKARLLDPPTDGNFGSASRWALGAFFHLASLDPAKGIDSAAAQALLGDVGRLLPITAGTALGDRLAAAMTQGGYWMSHHPECFNIIYVEGMSPDGSPNDNKPDHFNDARFLLQVKKGGVPTVVGAWEATTEAGKLYTLNPMVPAGAARIALGQQKAWSVGLHPGSGANQHEALIQTGQILVHRDLNEDFMRDGDKTETGFFGVNQHWGYDLPVSQVKDASAGCLVGRETSGHRAFMALLKTDPRYGANHAYRFMTTVLRASDITG